MWIHEYQAKTWLEHFGIPVPGGMIARSASQAVTAAETLGGNAWVVKAQVHAGGRGKAGGIRMARDLDAVRTAATTLIGSRLVTSQTGPSGAPVDCVWIETPCLAVRELYMACVVDRARSGLRLMASDTGGVDIEDASSELLSVVFDPVAGLDPYACRKLAYRLALPAAAHAHAARILWQLHRLFLTLDLTMAEINPLVLTVDEHLLALDAKLQVDDNALFRHADLEALRDPRQEEDREAQARTHGLNFVALDGNIGCMVNGAGLAMATMDLIKLHGGSPANFLDVGGGATSDRVAQAFDLVTSAGGVRAVLVNIFGGIVRCDLIAEGILNAVRARGVDIPVIVRLEGTNAERGRQILSESGLRIVAARTLDEAAAQAVALAGTEG